MATVPIARQVRRPVKVSGGAIMYEVTTTIIEKGDLPFSELFVLTINDPLDPKSDILARVASPNEFRQADTSAPIFVKVVSSDLITISGDPFARIASVADVTGLLRERAVAVHRGHTQYLSSSVTLQYVALATADAAYRELLQRLSDLVVEWRTVQSAWATSPLQDYPLPQTSLGEENRRTAIYKGKKDARKAAEAKRDAAQAAKDACVKDCASDKIVLDILIGDVAFLERAKTIVQGKTETIFTTLNLTGGTTLTPPQTYTISATLLSGTSAKVFALDGSPESYETLLLKKRTMRDQYAVKVAACNANCALLGDALATVQQTVTTAQAAETSSLADLVAICPTFDPNTV